MPKDVNWNDLEHFEEEDNTTGSQELACVGAVRVKLFKKGKEANVLGI